MQLAAVGPTRIEQIIYRADKGDGPKRYRHDFEEKPVAVIRGDRLSIPVAVKADKGPGQKETGWLVNPMYAEQEKSVPVLANGWTKVPIYATSLKRTGIVSEQQEMGSPDSAAKLFKTLVPDDGTEHIAVAFLNTKNRIIGVQDASRGTVDRSPVFPREIARAAVACNAKSVIIGHNHPSGDLVPSRDDIALTEAVNKALKSTGVGLLDHVIFSHEDSMAKLHSIRQSSPVAFNPIENQTSRMIGRNALQPNPILSKGGEMLTARKTRSVSGVNHYVVSGPSRQSVSRRSRSMVLSSSDPVYPNPRHKRGHGVRIFVNPISKHGAKVWLGRAAAVAGGVGIYFLAEWGLAKLDFFAKVHPSWMPLAVAGVGAAAGVVGAMVFKSTIIGLAIAAFPVIKGVWDAVKHYRALSAPLPASQGPASQSIPGLGYLSENQIAALPPGSIVRDEDGNDWNVGGNQIADNQIANFPMATRSVSGFPISRLGDGRGIVRNF